MLFLRRLVVYFSLAVFLNLILVFRVFPNSVVSGLVAVALAVFFIYFNIVPCKDKSQKRRMRILIGGYELVLAAITCSTLEAFAYLYVITKGVGVELHILIINASICAGLIFVLLFNGIMRIFTCSGQLGLMPRIALLLFWWLPVINIILLKKFLTVSASEYKYMVDKLRLNTDRRHEELCKTKYPILMVHGIFFRDWKNFNYWGRIPKELTDNGAEIYYGSHQSSASVEQCADELKKCILEIIHNTGCEKVNIIAHSKGGLDSRYAVSCLGISGQVASLTTINTPHMGCNYVRRLLEVVPQKVIMTMGKKYESIYTKLGDDNPDFFSGLKDLTDKECERLNSIMKDAPGVLYQSVGSNMHSLASAMFPLNVGYGIIKLFGGGENDGLVSTESMAWGDFLGIVCPKGKRGISHGDIIDLTRKNIEGFDVCEFYVDIVNKLKAREL